MPTGHIIADLRYKEHLTQSDLAKIVGVSKGAVGMWETNKRYPTTENLICLSKYFHVTTDYILGLSQDKSSDMDDSPKNSVSNCETLTDRQANMFRSFNKLNDDNQDIIIGETKKLLKEQMRDDYLAKQSLKKVN